MLKLIFRKRKKKKIERGEEDEIHSDNQIGSSRDWHLKCYLNYQINEGHQKRRSLKRNKKRPSIPKNIDLFTYNDGCFIKNIYFSLAVDELFFCESM